MHEFDVIERFFRPLAGPEALDLLDDAACLPPVPGHDLIITKDVLVEGVHFFKGCSPESLAIKALGVNASDCAAKGAQPRFYWLGLTLQEENTPKAWLKHFSEGLHIAQQRFGCILAGGDTTRTTGPLVISVTMAGYVPSGKMLRRSGALIGDDVYVTGFLGDAAFGLKVIESKITGFDALIEAYHHPAPPVALGPLLIDTAHASADVSDGLLADAGHIAKASKIALVIQQDLLPVSPSGQNYLRQFPDASSLVFTGGDDYQILFTAPRDKREPLKALAQESNLVLSRIGVCEEGAGVRLLDADGKTMHIKQTGFRHF